MIFSKLLKMKIFLKSFHLLFIPKGMGQYPHQDSPNTDGNNRETIVFAGVIYLNPDLDKINYTQFYELTDINYHKIQHITSFVGNRFNKLVIYDGEIYHSPGEGFGNDLDNPQDTRLTATYFLDAYHYENI